MGKEQQVNRPIRNSEYKTVAGSAAAQRGWRDLIATHRNLMVEAREFLTPAPHRKTPTNYPLRGELATVSRNGASHERWQHKPSQGNGARIWFYVEDQTACLEKACTNHPKQTE
ncbi:hypothetical protein JD292_05720 [Leucobacter sp. CSA2]|uniref:Uncharacterized protein n=1 Tax=Leucobacter edaphi TaxID=2796472 RepID=A0A934UXG2_9MICO|nr:hypothetical protein [Leucobacter edaphi]MBK0421566.1 hypothetical protein [Leucobacter edaphi]